jgi:hypothetical protein
MNEIIVTLETRKAVLNQEVVKYVKKVIVSHHKQTLQRN